MDANYTLDDLRYLMRRLRAPESGCPWDLKQDFRSITAATIEEAYEVVDAIENGDREQVKEELGDLLFQIIFYSQLAQEEASFSWEQIVHTLTEKLVRRHPHVFPSGDLHAINSGDTGPTDVKAQWEAIKSEERAKKGLTQLLDDIPLGLPAMTRAYKLQKRAASIGYDWRALEPVFAKLDEEVMELKAAIDVGTPDAILDELGDVLFTVVNIARHLKAEPETALRRSNARFGQRINAVVKLAESQGRDLDALNDNELDELWRAAKISTQ
ncbi:MAG TPA: nucleoside triphosphate pyrophosphohydrolase [Marinagarivorans sp.]